MAESKDNSRDVPSKEELGQLPRKAVIAFAARCALRVQPLFKHGWPDAPEEHIKAIDKAITLAQAAAALPAGASEPKADADTAAAAAYAIVDESNVNADAAAYAASYAAATLLQSSAEDFAHSAVAHAVRATVDITGDIRLDYELLKVISQQEGWDDDTAVPPEFFGPLWPEGEPEGWPEEGREERAGDTVLTIEIDLPEDADDDDIEQAVLELVERMEDMHHAEGGRGIVIDAVEIPLKSKIPSEVC